jgi:serine-type D-Ala-D-Ala carboxypeptidase/endopeptidase (penicillin-binding protein 4)
MSRRAAREAAGPAKRGTQPRQGRGRQGQDAGAPGTPNDDPNAPKPTGIAALFANHRTAWLVGAGAIVFVLLGSGAVFAGVSVGSAAEPEPSPTPTVEPLRDLPDGELTASRLRTCSIAALAADPRLMTLEAQVVRVDTGEVLFDRAGDTPARTASVLKLLTAAAALATMGPDFQITTSVLQGSAPGSIVLVGRGDATLSALPPGSESVYRGAPKLADLAAATLAAYTGPEITNIVLDASYWSTGDKWDSSWKRSEQTQGYHSEVTALQIDGDRENPARQDSPRSTDPVGRAGVLFLNALRDADTEGEVADDVTFTVGTAVSSTTLAEVKSQPLRALIPYMLLVSDNTLAEMLARITSKQGASNGSAASLQQVIPSALSEYDIPATGLTIRDGSGLSDLNAVPPSTVVKLLIAMQLGGPNLDVMASGLPVAGQTGTLSGRFTGANAVARGHVSAKTGWIDTSYSLAGIVRAADGQIFAFAFYAIGDGIQSNARAALDTLTTGVFNCGDNLSNN